MAVIATLVLYLRVRMSGLVYPGGPGNTEGGRITVPLTSCLTDLESAMPTDNFCFYF